MARDSRSFARSFQMAKTKRAKAIPHYVVLKWDKNHPMIDPMYPIKKEWEIIKEYDDEGNYVPLNNQLGNVKKIEIEELFDVIDLTGNDDEDDNLTRDNFIDLTGGLKGGSVNNKQMEGGTQQVQSMQLNYKVNDTDKKIILQNCKLILISMIIKVEK